jgi:uncharacterized membrane protein HdeD (DUF308 family)
MTPSDTDPAILLPHIHRN